MNSKKGFINELNATFSFPGYFGHNLDASWDCMTDLSWLNTSEITIIITNWKSSKKNLKFDYFKFFDDVQSFWNESSDVPFKITYQ